MKIQWLLAEVRAKLGKRAGRKTFSWVQLQQHAPLTRFSHFSLRSSWKQQQRNGSVMTLKTVRIFFFPRIHFDRVCVYLRVHKWRANLTRCLWRKKAWGFSCAKWISSKPARFYQRRYIRVRREKEDRQFIHIGKFFIESSLMKIYRSLLSGPIKRNPLR